MPQRSHYQNFKTQIRVVIAILILRFQQCLQIVSIKWNWRRRRRRTSSPSSRSPFRFSLPLYNNSNNIFTFFLYTTFLSYIYLFVSDSFLNLAVVNVSGYFLFSGFFSFSGYPFGIFRYTTVKVCICIGSILWFLNFDLTSSVIYLCELVQWVIGFQCA